MEKLWAGRFKKELDKTANDFNSSINVDSRMFRQDIEGSIAHATMLGAKGIISKEDAEAITEGLEGILCDIESGAIAIDAECEDIHMFVEKTLTARIGDAGKRLHTARSRNDQVSLDVRMYLRGEADAVVALIKELIAAIVGVAKDHRDAVMPGYTHLQRAQPITFAHHILAYAMMLERDVSRINDAARRMNVNPLGSCALAGTTFDIDRAMTTKLLGFDSYTLNSIDGVSDRDFCVELLAALSLVMTHLSRFSEEIILWSSWEFKFVELDDSFTTGDAYYAQRTSSRVQQGYAGGQGSDIRRVRYREDVPRSLRADGSDDDGARR